MSLGAHLPSILESNRVAKSDSYTHSECNSAIAIAIRRPQSHCPASIQSLPSDFLQTIYVEPILERSKNPKNAAPESALNQSIVTTDR